MRGKDPQNRRNSRSRRITPAYAGKNFPAHSRPRQIQDHPRLCGEKNSVLGDVREVSGSPPPMRGKIFPQNTPRTVAGITPAYAGKKSAYISPDVGAWDHPRLCGEKPDITHGIMISTGSPPPMRGKNKFGFGRVGAAGITPAYAGKNGRTTCRKVT